LPLQAGGINPINIPGIMPTNITLPMVNQNMMMGQQMQGGLIP